MTETLWTSLRQKARGLWPSLWLSDSAYLTYADFKHRWFPYRLYEWLPDGSTGPARWQWPDVLGRPFR